ncbi:MAG: WD40 repeat domain-containing protein [Planctomycetales bacterium]
MPQVHPRKQRRDLPPHRWGALLALALWSACLSPALAQESPVQGEAPPAALRFARHDVARWAAQIESLTQAAAKATASLESANKNFASAKAAQEAADKVLAESAAAEQTQAAAAKMVSEMLDGLKKVQTETPGDQAALVAAQTLVETAAKGLQAAARDLATKTELKKQAARTKPQIDQQVAELQPLIQPATDAKAAADKALAEATTFTRTAQERLAAFEKSAPAADPAATRLVQTITHDRPLLSCRFDPQGNFLFAGAQDNSLHRWDLYSGVGVHPKVHKSWLGTLAVVSPGDPRILTGGHEGLLTWWEGATPDPQALRTIGAHRGYLRAVTVSPDGLLVATAGNDHMVRIWSATDGTLVKELAGHPRHVYSVAFHPSGKALVSGDLMGGIRQWEVGSWGQTRELDAKLLSKFDPTFQADVGGVRCFAFSPDGKHLAAGGITEVSNAFAGIGVPCVVLFDWESGKSLKVMKPKDNVQGSVFGLRFSPAGDFLIGAGGGSSGLLWFWKLDDEKSFQATALPSVAYDLDLHPDGLRIAVALYDKTLRVYDMSPKFEAAPAK